MLGGTRLIGRRMVEYSFTGPINGTSAGTVSVCDVAAYVEKQTGKSMLLASDGLPGPYNGEKAYSICTDLAQKSGFSFSYLDTWFYDFLDVYISQTAM